MRTAEDDLFDISESPDRVRAMASQGKLTPERRAEYRAGLDRLRAIEDRYREPRSDGEIEMHRIARWVLDRWTSGDRKLLGSSDRGGSD